jgi:Fe-S cluster assembly protein SufB
VDPKLLETYTKLGIPLTEQKLLAGVAVDAVFDSVSVGTTYKEELAKLGIVFCSFGEAVREHPELVRKYLGSVVPYSDNFFASLNSAGVLRRLVRVRAEGRSLSDGAVDVLPHQRERHGPVRAHAHHRGRGGVRQLPRRVHGAQARREPAARGSGGAYRAGERDRQVLTVQNWYAGDEEGNGGVYNFVTKRGKALGRKSKISWTQVETGSAITWKYPSVILQGDESVGEFYSVAVVNRKQQADTGTKMIHIGKNTKSNIVSKGISAGEGNNSYRGRVQVLPRATGARNYTQCDSMLVGNRCGAHTFPYIEVGNNTATVEHEASTSKIGEDQIFYLKQRGLSAEQAVSMIVSGFCREVFKELPMEFALEAQQLLGITLEGSVG